MNAVSAPITPGSMKARILEAIIDLGDSATSHAIRKRHPSNEALVDLSLGQLSADGYVEVTSEGAYALTAEAKRVIKGESITQAVAAIRGNQASIGGAEKKPDEPAPSRVSPDFRQCLVCSQTKAILKNFFGRDRTCNECRQKEADRRQEQSDARRAAAAPAKANGHAAPPADEARPAPSPPALPAAPAPKPTAAVHRADPSHNEVMIAAPGSLICRAEVGVLVIIQSKQSIAVDRELVPALIEWLSAQVAA